MLTHELSGDYEQAVIDEIWDSAPDGDGTYLAALKAYRHARFQATPGGRVIINTSANGVATSFEIASANNATDVLTPVTLTKLCSRLIRIYEHLVSKGITDEGEIKAFHKNVCDPVTQGYSDYGDLRLVTGFQWT